ncbi:hypothetical protein EVAR_28570_1 [Eumeta japonica]|uniref:Uncharacterized protein n=1 Tax=Eumeta variegata TaxID=151549 RepID=A0A4C1UXC0_EUMVA|nr:hypothetical protein EVAR_28570_1 [Eumeta japonica]
MAAIPHTHTSRSGADPTAFCGNSHAPSGLGSLMVRANPVRLKSTRYFRQVAVYLSTIHARIPSTLPFPYQIISGHPLIRPHLRCRHVRMETNGGKSTQTTLNTAIRAPSTISSHRSSSRLWRREDSPLTSVNGVTENGPTRLARDHTSKEYRRELNSFYCGLPSGERELRWSTPPPRSHSPFHQNTPPLSNILFVPKEEENLTGRQRTGDSGVTGSMGGDHLLFDSSHVRLPLEAATKKLVGRGNPARDRQTRT